LWGCLKGCISEVWRSHCVWKATGQEFTVLRHSDGWLTEWLTRAREEQHTVILPSLKPRTEVRKLGSCPRQKGDGLPLDGQWRVEIQSKQRRYPKNQGWIRACNGHRFSVSCVKWP
jgi:hypothetical protein